MALGQKTKNLLERRHLIKSNVGRSEHNMRGNLGDGTLVTCGICQVNPMKPDSREQYTHGYVKHNGKYYVFLAEPFINLGILGTMLNNLPDVESMADRAAFIYDLEEVFVRK